MEEIKLCKKLDIPFALISRPQGLRGSTANLAPDKAHSTVVGIIFPPGWDRVNCNPKFRQGLALEAPEYVIKPNLKSPKMFLHISKRKQNFFFKVLYDNYWNIVKIHGIKFSSFFETQQPYPCNKCQWFLSRVSQKSPADKVYQMAAFYTTFDLPTSKIRWRINCFCRQDKLAISE